MGNVGKGSRLSRTVVLSPHSQEHLWVLWRAVRITVGHKTVCATQRRPASTLFFQLLDPTRFSWKQSNHCYFQDNNRYINKEVEKGSYHLG